MVGVVGSSPIVPTNIYCGVIPWLSELLLPASAPSPEPRKLLHYCINTKKCGSCRTFCRSFCLILQPSRKRRAG